MGQTQQTSCEENSYKKLVKLNQDLERDQCPSAGLMVIHKTLFLNRAVTGIAVSCNGSSVFTTSQGTFSHLKNGFPRATVSTFLHSQSRTVLACAAPT